MLCRIWRLDWRHGCESSVYESGTGHSLCVLSTSDHILAINASPRQTPLHTRNQPVFVLVVCPGPAPRPKGQDVPKGRIRGDSPVYQSGPGPRPLHQLILRRDQSERNPSLIYYPSFILMLRIK